MTAINFPDDPSVGDLFTVSGRTWRWAGTVWLSASVNEFETLDGGTPATDLWGNSIDGGTP
jgi:hypothetical protein